MLSNHDIEKIAKIMRIPLAGIVMRNEKYPSAKMKLLVINLDDITGPGTHWVGLIEFPERFIYFDSFGFDAPQEVSNFINSKPLYYNNDVMQSIRTKNCGWFVLYWAFLMLVEKKDPSIIEDDFINEHTVKAFKARVSNT